MPNNIHAINEELQAKAEERRKEAAENFERDTTLTPEEQQRLADIKNREETVIKEVRGDGTSNAIPVSEFASNLETQIKEIRTQAGDMVAKGLNVGDIKRNLDSLKQESKDKALTAFRKMSVIDGDATSDGGNIDDDTIMEINDEAIRCVMKLLNTDRLNSNDIPKYFKGKTLRTICELLPPRFTHMYLTHKEVMSDNIQAKNRLIQTLVYLSLTGPEMDYLNEYIDQQNKLMLLSNRIIQIQMNMTEVLKSPERISEIIRKAAVDAPQDTTSVWAKYIKDPQKVHNLFAQMAVTMDIMRKSYEEILEEYKDDYDCRKMIQEQIDECVFKHDAYQRVTDLETFIGLRDTLTVRFKTAKKNDYRNMVREGVAAVDRIRRSKQNVLFPIYRPDLAGSKKADYIFNAYMIEYPAMLRKYNDTVNSILANNANSENPMDTNGIEPIHIDGYDDNVVMKYFSLILLIMMGRIMKALSGEDVSKFDAIELDCYFKMYCKAGTDVYLMNKLWLSLKEFTEFCMIHWPMNAKGVSGK